MAEYTDDLALIVRYDGTKKAFEAVKSNYLGKVVFITGSSATGATTDEKKQAIWVSNGVGGKYLDMSNIDALKSELEYITKIYVGTESFDGTGGIAYKFVGADGIGVTLSQANGQAVITFSGTDLKTDLIGTSGNGSNVAECPNTITGAKKYTDKVASDLKGTKDADDNTAQTIEGAKDYADKVKADLEGTKAEGDTTAQTIEGAKKYADGKAATAKNEAIASSEAYANTMKAQAISSSVVSVDTTTTTEGASKSYTFKQGGVTIATIDIPKDMVVSKGSVVKGTWNGDTFTESTSGTGTAIKLEIANGDTLYINAATLVDVYTAQQNATEIQLAVSASNVISATIVNGAVSEAKIAANAVTTAKIKNGNVTKAKLETAVQTSLGKADSAIQKVTSDAEPYIKATTATDKKEVTITATTIALGDVEGNTLLGAQNGLATAEDVFAYLKARLSVKVVS